MVMAVTRTNRTRRQQAGGQQTGSPQWQPYRTLHANFLPGYNPGQTDMEAKTKSNVAQPQIPRFIQRKSNPTSLQADRHSLCCRFRQTA
jgi:hypothetical protein